jgi:biopolymer transport protein ExbD
MRVSANLPVARRLARSRAMRIRRRELSGEDFQMAPMIDMVFLLLVFFMCVSSLSQAEKRTPVSLPESAESKVPEDLKDRAIVTVQAGGGLFIGGEAADLDGLGQRLRAALASNPKLRLQVRADARATFAEIKKVLRACAEVGAYEIIYATNQTD